MYTVHKYRHKTGMTILASRGDYRVTVDIVFPELLSALKVKVVRRVINK